jgi:hypothetical protein
METTKTLGLTAAVALVLSAGCAVELPENEPIEEARWLSQNWSPEERYWFHHATQGTASVLVPYDWFMALEQPRLWMFGDPPLFSDTAYLSRYGFIPDVKDVVKDDPAARAAGYDYGGGREHGTAVSYDPDLFYGNPDGLPVGFARIPASRNPLADQDQLGFTCAACHTGHLEYQGVSLRIDGGPAVTNLGAFQNNLVLALSYTRYLPFRFERFAERVLGADYSDADYVELKEKFTALVADFKDLLKRSKLREHDIERNGGPVPVKEGFARLDALNRIGNQVFVIDMLHAEGLDFDIVDNWAPVSAPVSFPHIWSTSWFAWVQYDSSIEQPMVRNAGEAMGVAAQVNLGRPNKDLYASSVQVGELATMETLLAGAVPPTEGQRFTGLVSPKWPDDLLGPIDEERRARGAALYQRHCAGCHLPPVDDPAFWHDAHWTAPVAEGMRFLKLKEIPLAEIGTDPAQATVLGRRMIRVPEYLGIKLESRCEDPSSETVTQAPFAYALASVVEHTVDHWYDANQVPPEERARMNGKRPNCVKASEVYKARPLNGIWATAPFLHNASVPTLWDLLSPAAERPVDFCTGTRRFDPNKVGYETGCRDGDFRLDTRLAGNRNGGHEFDDGPRGNGVIGAMLSEAERWDLIEYLKSL